MHDPLPAGETEHPHAFYFQPVYRSIEDLSDVVGVVTGDVALDRSSRNLLPKGVNGILIVIRNTCNQSYTYELIGPEAIYLGKTDMHDPRYDEYEVTVNMTVHTNPKAYTAPGHCFFTMSIYPTARFYNSYDKKTPEIFAGIGALTFVMVAIVFFVYDLLVHQRNAKIVTNAARTNAIVTQLFPGKLRQQVIAQKKEEEERKLLLKGKTELFLEATVLFADIVGFTAWSSSREPAQVFVLLETLFQAFDDIAKRHRVFKVETVGDCYVAAAGIPEPQRDHAVVMGRFAHAILARMAITTKKLEVSLGPDTGDLSIRVGIHSGPVTAGVLRGERARFQLFGDTMNTAARIESTGEPGRVHVSKATANSIMNAGKGHWLEKREDIVFAKGLGDMNTYFLVKVLGRGNARNVQESSKHSGSVLGENDEPLDDEEENLETGQLSKKTHRLIDWNVKTLLPLIQEIVACQSRNASMATVPKSFNAVKLKLGAEGNSLFLDEVKEIITLPEFDDKAFQQQSDSEKLVLDPNVEVELRQLVTCIACLYRNNPFHNFEHASHVVMSVTKLLSRIVAPSDLDQEDERELHDHTYGITSDPLTQFSCVFSALIHDVDHQGVPNAQLIKENAPIASKYASRSVAEQNSLELSLSLLQGREFATLRDTIAATEEELSRFRQLVINSVMATDIVDKELKTLRNQRWDKAFMEVSETAAFESSRDAINRKATIVIEHLIQASDVSHTMQHWHVYRKWNQRFFFECYNAFKEGRTDTDPSQNWYKGEMGFFDFYIIPLAKKLKECGVFGVSSGEYLNYALGNRIEWEARGKEIVAEMMEIIRKKRDELMCMDGLKNCAQGRNEERELTLASN